MKGVQPLELRHRAEVSISCALRSLFFSLGKSVASWYGVDVFFSTPNKLQKLCHTVARKLDKNKENAVVL